MPAVSRVGSVVRIGAIGVLDELGHPMPRVGTRSDQFDQRSGTLSRPSAGQRDSRVDDVAVDDNAEPRSGIVWK